jgi:hypothetical protein
LRLANVIKALQPLGEVDLFVATRDSEHASEFPTDPLINRGVVSRVRMMPLSAGRRLSWFARGDAPVEIAIRDVSEIRRAFPEFISGERYDLTWVSRLETFTAVESSLSAPTIIDIDDLRDDLVTTRFTAHESDGLRRGFAGSLKVLQTRRNASLWTRLQERAADAVRAVVVCSERDRARIRVPNARVVANGYDAPDRPLGKTKVGRPPTILLQGMLNYPPNVDGARFLVHRVAPLVRRRLPDTKVRIVGRPAPSVNDLAGSPGVIVTGWVPSMEAELQRADLVAVPIRFGGGTRIKILEAFAHRIPVVSTSFGAYGLDVVDGEHLLLADTPDAFADACITLLTDERERQELVDSAEELFLQKYQWCHIAESIRELALSVA